MRIHIGGDHAAFELQQALIVHLQDAGHEVFSHGPHSYDAQDHYPAFVLRAASAVAAECGSLGIVLGGSGNGEQIAANKVSTIRAAHCSSVEYAQLARQHNNAQVLAIGARFTPLEEAKRIVDAFVSTPFEGGRHQVRIDMISAFEKQRIFPPN